MEAGRRLRGSVASPHPVRVPDAAVSARMPAGLHSGGTRPFGRRIRAECAFRRRHGEGSGPDGIRGVVEIARTCAEVRAALKPLRQGGRRIALVPTMGDLHGGHIALMRRAGEIAPVTVASIFVNPFQFGEGEDFDSYPRTLGADIERFDSLGVDVVFLPPVSEIYPTGPECSTRVEVPGLSSILCGATRPTFFRGVATVVSMLFNVVRPDVALFGEKDYQQLLVVKRLTEDLKLPVAIESVATVRERDGLAMSSRNRYLDPAERSRAPKIYRSLREAADRIRGGEHDYHALGLYYMGALERAGFRPEYFTVRRARDLESPISGDPELVLLAAAWLGPARLIDNLSFTLPCEPEGRSVPA